MILVHPASFAVLTASAISLAAPRGIGVPAAQPGGGDHRG